MADIQFADFGNALSSGAAAGAHSAAAARARQEDEDRIAAKPLIKPALGGDVNAQIDLLAADPKTAAVVYQALSRMDANKQAHAKTAADYTVNATTGILGAPPADRPRLYAMTLEDAKAKGIDTSTWPAQYDEGFVRFNHTRGVGAKAFFEEQGKKERHQPGGGGGPTQLDMPGSGGMPAPASRPAGPAMSAAPAAPGPVIAQAPTAGPADMPTQVAQAPTQAPDGIPTAPPHIAQGDSPRPPLGDASGNPLPPQDQPRARPTGSIWSEDPTKYGLVMRGERDKYGNVKPVDVGGHFLFRDPKTNEHVLYRPRPERQLPPGYEASPGGGLAPIAGGPADPTVQRRERVPPGYRADADGNLEFIPGGPADPSIAKRSAPMNNEQARDAGFADRMQNSNGLLDRMAAQGTNFWDRLADKAPGGTGNYAQSEDYQLFRQAKDDFINAQLRRESGAAINADEYTKADKQYFPQPGDKPEVLKQKALNRKIAVEAMVRGAGPAYTVSPSVGGGAPKPDAPAKGGTYIGPDQRPIGFDEIQATAKNRGITPEEVIKKLNLQPAPR